MRLKMLLTTAAMSAMVFLLTTPVLNTLIRYATLLGSVCLYAMLVWLMWEKPFLRNSFINLKNRTHGQHKALARSD